MPARQHGAYQRHRTIRKGALSLSTHVLVGASAAKERKSCRNTVPRLATCAWPSKVRKTVHGQCRHESLWHSTVVENSLNNYLCNQDMYGPVRPVFVIHSEHRY